MCSAEGLLLKLLGCVLPDVALDKLNHELRNACFGDSKDEKHKLKMDGLGRWYAWTLQNEELGIQIFSK
jgi:hypothetical protein